MLDTHAWAVRTLGAHCSRWVSIEGPRFIEVRLVETHSAARSWEIYPALTCQWVSCERTFFFNQVPPCPWTLAILHITT